MRNLLDDVLLGVSRYPGMEIRLQEQTAATEIGRDGNNRVIRSAEELIIALSQPAFFAAGYDIKRASALESAFSLLNEVYDDVLEQIRKHAASQPLSAQWQTFFVELCPAKVSTERDQRIARVRREKTVGIQRLDPAHLPHGRYDPGMTTLVNPVRSRKRLLMIAPVMPSDRGNGLAMRAGFFLDAYARRFDVDLVVAPVFGDVTVSDFARSRAGRIEILRIDRPDSHYALVSSVSDPLAPALKPCGAMGGRHSQPSSAPLVTRSLAWRSKLAIRPYTFSGSIWRNSPRLGPGATAPGSLLIVMRTMLLLFTGSPVWSIATAIRSQQDRPRQRPKRLSALHALAAESISSMRHRRKK